MGVLELDLETLFAELGATDQGFREAGYLKCASKFILPARECPTPCCSSLDVPHSFSPRPLVADVGFVAQWLDRLRAR